MAGPGRPHRSETAAGPARGRTRDAARVKVLTLHAEYLDPMTGKPSKAKTVTTVVDDDKHTFDYYAPGPDGKMFRAMAMVYTRR